MVSDKPLVAAQAVRVYAPASTVLLVENIDFNLDAGRVLTIIGPNGAGKSSLVKAVAGELKTTGQLSFYGFAEHPTQRARQIAVLPQLSLLSFPFQVHEVVALGRLPHATGWAQDKKIINQVLEKLDISSLASRQYTDLSGGEKQRVQLARVLCQIWTTTKTTDYPRLLLLDEPTSALDLGHQHQLMQVVRDIADQGVGVIMVMHDINLAAQYSDTMLAMVNRRAVAYGNARSVVTKSTIKKLFHTDVEILSHPKHGAPLLVS